MGHRRECLKTWALTGPIDQAIERALADEQIPGCVVLYIAP